MEENDSFNINMMPLSFYKAGGVYTGGNKAVRYMVRKEDGDGDVRLVTYIWPGPFRFSATDDELKKSSSFELSDDGIAEAAAWLGETAGTIK